MKRKNLVLSFACLLSTIVFAQSSEFQIVDSLKNKVSNSNSDGIEVYPIETVNATCKKFEMVEVKDSTYELKLQLLDTLKASKIELTNKLSSFNTDNQELGKARNYLDQFIQDPEPSLMFKWQYLKNAQECLDKTSYKIDLYRSKDDVFTKSGGKSPYNVENYVLKQRGMIINIINDGNNLQNKIDFISKKIEKENENLSHLNKYKKVELQTGVMVRPILKVSETNIGNAISGRFVKELGPIGVHGESSYFIMKQDYRQFIKNELIIKDSLEKYTYDYRNISSYAGGSVNYIIKNVETQQLYYTTGNILSNWGMDYYIYQLYSQINKLNISHKTIEDKTYLSYNGFQCVLTNDISASLMKNDASCIRSMSESVKKHNEYLNKAIDLASKLSNCIKQYKSGLPISGGIDTWKKYTKECDIILGLMKSLPYANSENYNLQLNISDVETHSSILDIVQYSKGKLGLQ